MTRSVTLSAHRADLNHDSMSSDAESTATAPPRYRRVKRFSTAAVAAMAMMMFMLGVSGTASAASSYIYTQSGRPSALASCDQGCGVSTGTFIYPSNGTGASMFCYYDSSSSYNGNYASNRYYKVFIDGHSGLWFIHSSYIYYQTTVKPC